MTVERARIGWVANVPPNGFRNRPSADAYASNDNPLGLATPDNDLETTPEHRNLAAGDPTCATWTRRFDDPFVVAYRERLAQESGIRGLPIVGPDEVEKAVQLFHRDGFVVVRDALTPTQTARLRAATDRQVDRILAIDPQAAVGGGAGGLPHRYSFGSSSGSRHMMHEQEWCAVIDLPTTTPILTEIFGSADYLVLGGGGDVALPGAIEYQGLHSDNLWKELPDPAGQVSMRDLPVPVLTINFTVCNLTTDNGPIRQIPGSQRSRQPIPTLADEPEWMKFSTICPVPAGCAIFRVGARSRRSWIVSPSWLRTRTTVTAWPRRASGSPATKQRRATPISARATSSTSSTFSAGTFTPPEFITKSARPCHSNVCASCSCTTSLVMMNWSSVTSPRSVRQPRSSCPAAIPGSTRNVGPACGPLRRRNATCEHVSVMP